MVRRYDLAMSEPVAEQITEDVQRIVQGYTFDEPAVELGVLMENDAPIRPAIIRIPLSMLNRHGLVAGATGTGKTKTLQLMAEPGSRELARQSSSHSAARATAYRCGRP